MVALPLESAQEPLIYRARWVLPMVSPPLEDGAVLVSDGVIRQVGRYLDLSRKSMGVKTQDLGEVILLPGLVNAHTHLDNSAFQGKTPRGDGEFVAWIEAMLAVKDDISPQDRAEGAEGPCRSLVEYGTMAVADISPTAVSPPLLAAQHLWAVVFVEVTGFSLKRGEANYQEASHRLTESQRGGYADRLRISLSPHALYSTHAEIIRRIFMENRRKGLLTSIHLAESRQEVDFLNGETAPFKHVMDRWGYWDKGWRSPKTGPAYYLKSLGGLGPGTIAVHCVHLEDEELALLADSGCSVCLCPRSNDYIGVGHPRLEAMLRAGIKPCLGTDGLGSVESLSLFDEMAYLRKTRPDIDPATVLAMATVNGAAALRLEALLGGLAPGKIARFLAYPSDAGADPLEVVTTGIDHGRLSWIGALSE
jgi:cytosine/adenosine deaminase-related metal-dependent hydrolase